MGHARARKIPAQLVEDEDYQLRYERVAGIDIAKAKADVCTRLPPERGGGRRASRVEEVPARARDILDLGGRLLAGGVPGPGCRRRAVPGGWGGLPVSPRFLGMRARPRPWTGILTLRVASCCHVSTTVTIRGFRA